MTALVLRARIYRRLLGAHIRAALQYEADFWLLIVAATLIQVVGLVFLSAIFARIPQLNGWTFWEVLLIYAMVSIGEGVVSLFFEGTWHLAHRINVAELDYYVVRPYPVMLQVMGSTVGFNGIGNILTGGVMLGLALANVDIAWSVGTIALCVTLFASAIAIRLSIALATNAVSFWVPGPFNPFAYAMHQVGDLTRYPISIYSVAVQLSIGIAIPYAFASYFPVAVLLGHGDYAWLGMLTPLVAIYCGVAAWLIFRTGLRRYEGAGS
jgi:ABC-2 type transport system permease protein